MKTFSEKCYDILRKVPKGKVTTYAAIAHALGGRAYRAVGNAMNKNPYAPSVPCHRVIASDGSLGGFATGVSKKRKMLISEGIRIKNGVVEETQILRKL